ncbi:GNAT family N-acetyltransferase [Deinococcus sp. Arct2-2]|uniref:GNAT family N-acetyltransferase n=1 Tax=Deinococcus sp. Arct2-2 TaxID=2568653 RepID=UPI0010A5170E|nr:GNAT family N-acetyltransferase [Deinococcus sp. Arct2-2]THF70732.1 GNAT family N-acetyltransferase [Deinococcus sp. Arct2-2]
MTNGRIRWATPADASALAWVHVSSWRDTYAGRMPAAFLAGMTDAAAQERRRVFWERHVGSPDHVTLVAELGKEVVAFVSGGPTAERDHPSSDAELHTLYALPHAKGLGLGRRLTAMLAEELQARGFQSLFLWVLDVNPTRAFYLHLGGREAGEKIETIPGGELREIRLVWDDLASLIPKG